MPINRSLVQKMIKRIKAVPESYDQAAFYVEQSSGAPCGTVACLAGEAVICNATTPGAGIKKAFYLVNGGGIVKVAAELLMLPEDHGVFEGDGGGWPEPHSINFEKAKTQKGRAQVAVAYLQECLERGKMIW